MNNKEFKDMIKIAKGYRVCIPYGDTYTAFFTTKEQMEFVLQSSVNPNWQI